MTVRVNLCLRMYMWIHCAHVYNDTLHMMYAYTYTLIYVYTHSSCPAPNVVTDNNFDRFIPKYFHCSDRELHDRYVELQVLNGDNMRRR